MKQTFNRNKPIVDKYFYDHQFTKTFILKYR